MYNCSLKWDKYDCVSELDCTESQMMEMMMKMKEKVSELPGFDMDMAKQAMYQMKVYEYVNTGSIFSFLFEKTRTLHHHPQHCTLIFSVLLDLLAWVKNTNLKKL